LAKFRAVLPLVNVIASAPSRRARTSSGSDVAGFVS